MIPQSPSRAVTANSSVTKKYVKSQWLLPSQRIIYIYYLIQQHLKLVLATIALKKVQTSREINKQTKGNLRK